MENTCLNDMWIWCGPYEAFTVKALRLLYTPQTDWRDNSEIPFCLSIAENDQSVQVKCSRSLPEFIAESVPGCVNEVKVNLSAISKWIKGELRVRRQSNEDNSKTVGTSGYIVNIHSTSLSLNSPPPAVRLKSANVQ